MWTARDKNGELYMYGSKPARKSISCWHPVITNDIIKINPNLFPNIKWEDKEPTEVELVIKK